MNMKRAYYSNSLDNFFLSRPNDIIGQLTLNSNFSVEQTQKRAWLEQITILKDVLKFYSGSIYFEYSIPRMGQRIDAVAIIGSVIFILEFKVGEKEFKSYAIDQVWDYALDLKNFHEGSHNEIIAPILIATEASINFSTISPSLENDKIFEPIKVNKFSLRQTIKLVLEFSFGKHIDKYSWESSSYKPTPTIIEAAKALYSGHSVDEITRSSADEKNLSITSDLIIKIIKKSKNQSKKSICFVTGVPGAGKTLVGLKITTQDIDDLPSVFLSGNGPLVKILQEALARDKVEKAKEKGEKLTKKTVLSEVKAFIQNVHHFRDDALIDLNKAPFEHVALFDEAQRAWNVEQTERFMRTKKNHSNFTHSEPEFLISCLDRHDDWAVVVCLVGGGQEINTGEAGISEWIDSLIRSFPDWHIYLSSRITDSEYDSGIALKKLKNRDNVYYRDDLHLSVSMRSFRAENVSLLIKEILDLEIDNAIRTLNNLKDKYPIRLTRNLEKAKNWLRQKARGSERYGIVVSAQAQRLKPYAIDVKSPVDPVHWFLDGKEDIRSSFYLEDVATEFHIQGLELDWVCVAWDADFRYANGNWDYWSFRGSRWNKIRKDERKIYLKNAYRVLLTRARQGMIIYVPAGDHKDPTRNPEFYDSTYKYLKQIGFEEI